MSEKIEALRKIIDEKALAKKLEEKRSGKFSEELRDDTLNKVKMGTSLIQPGESKAAQESQGVKPTDEISISFDKPITVGGGSDKGARTPDQPSSIDTGGAYGGIMFNITIDLDALPALFKKIFK